MNIKYYFVAQYIEGSPVQFGPFPDEEQANKIKSWLVNASSHARVGMPDISDTWNMVEN